jgi:RNA polymerase sigma-70 factor (ECF subfamily)
VATSPVRDDLKALHQRLRAALMAFFLRRVGSYAEAEDLTQEVFARLASSEPEMRQADAYVFQMAANLLRDRGRRQVTRTAGLKEIEASGGLQTQTLDSERIVIGRERLDEVVAALKELSERTRSIFLLYRLENMRLQDIATMYGMSVSGVRKHLIKAAAHLAARVGEPS